MKKEEKTVARLCKALAGFLFDSENHPKGGVIQFGKG